MNTLIQNCMAYLAILQRSHIFCCCLHIYYLLTYFKIFFSILISLGWNFCNFCLFVCIPHNLCLDAIAKKLYRTERTEKVSNLEVLWSSMPLKSKLMSYDSNILMQINDFYHFCGNTKFDIFENGSILSLIQPRVRCTLSILWRF